VKFETILSLIRFYSRIFYRYKEFGAENVPPTGPAIFGFNHPGKLLADLFAAIAIIQHREEIPTVIAPEGMYQGSTSLLSGGSERSGDAFAGRVLQRAVQLVPTIGIRRAGDSPANQNLEILKALQNGKAVMLAMEGEVSWHGRSNPSRRGAPWMALRSGAPFIPVAVSGSYDVWPRWESRPKFTGNITVRFGKPMIFRDEIPEWIDNEMVEEAGRKIMQAIDDLIG
jgi:1-acyl-sn-glycerol-3-phosphate acyltransferase